MPEVSKKMVQQAHHPESGRRITGGIKISPEIFSKAEEKIKNLADFKKEVEETLSSEITDILEMILAGSIILNASDLHIEPEEETAKIRLRVDGLLQDLMAINNQIFSALLSRIKLLSGIKFNVSDRPQDGRFSIETEKELIEIRTSTLPSEYGESIVLRVLNPKSLINLEALGLRKDLFELFKKEIKRPNGMIIVTGPTGSGKTTTLYAFLNKIQSPEIKIITIEDPIEYHLEGISQTQTSPKKGYGFINGLKSIMRQDPDVILVGEIRDLETAEIALQAALTGHLVLTTLHTNDAAGTIVRLISLGANLANIGPAINMAVAQRLIRKICPKCAKFKTASPQVIEKIKKEFKNLPKEVETPKITAGLKIPEAIGCKECNSTGYKGRVGVFEAFLVDDEMEKFILKKPSIAELKDAAIKKGMTTMKQDGFIKTLEGITTIEEVEKTTGE